MTDDGRKAARAGMPPGADGLEELVLATSTLAETIAATERLIQQTNDLLRSMGGGPGMARRHDGVGYVSLAEAARRSGRHPDVLRRWCSQGRVPAIRLGRNWAVSRETLARLMAESARARPAARPAVRMANPPLEIDGEGRT